MYLYIILYYHFINLNMYIFPSHVGIIDYTEKDFCILHKIMLGCSRSE